ncbi:NAD(P)-binding protein [Lentinula edodes]|uniref:NAD-binding protein n=1 Tax=Lentinula edodes TaxID=5353 RepID=A0A1Q3EDF8_LENED|nr:NAD(P)-binding protein [Lentinula edodes]KAH7873860.1 NAD(P)-binding protein [Lentinula edodes]KAJ3900844.1 NAD(P)-binding protein [Lentinula edodes]KAJ3915297.1 NAD(P)-binding protein [Lentinula edodes]GAW05240.1 NAD-binding protein [Lentinula edodes]
MTKILMTGVTGYIGGTILTRFAQRSDFETFDIRAIVRSSEKAEKLKSLFKNVTPILGSHSDIPLISQAASEVDVVIAMADCDDVDAATGTLQGLRKRFEETGKKSIFINTSGTGVLSDNAAGMYPTDIIWDDANPDQIATLKPTQPHRPVDLKIVGADAEGYVKTYIVLPATIWGISKGPLFTSGISNKKSVQIPALIRASLDRGHAGMVGLGKNIWPNVEIHELGDLYNHLFDAVVVSSSLPSTPGHGREGYYFGANEEHTLYQVGKSISDVMLKMHKSNGGEPTTFTQEEINKYFNGSSYLGSNSRCRPNRSKALGWAPKKTTQDMLDSVYPETELVIEIGAPAVSEKL